MIYTCLKYGGGEPSLYLYRAKDLITDLCNNNKDFHIVFFSSNFCSNNFRENVSDFVKFLSGFDRKITLEIQVSIDGPEELTDMQRGVGVTQKVIDNFNWLVNYDLPKSIDLRLHCKPTLDIETFKNFLDKEYIIKYYKFFEDNFIEVAENSKNKFIIPTPIPNIATPCIVSKEDGVAFGEVQKNLYELSIYNKSNKIFNYYTDLRTYYRKRDNHNIPDGYSMMGGFCGSGRNLLALLPEGKACGCHREFMYIAENYGKLASEDNFSRTIVKTDMLDYRCNKDILIFNNKTEYEHHNDRMKAFINNGTTSLVVYMTSMIRLLAKGGQIDAKYDNEEESRKAAMMLMRFKTFCLDDNLALCGNVMTNSTSMYKLFLNGALDYMTDEV